MATPAKREIIIRADVRGSSDIKKIAEEMGRLNKSTRDIAKTAGTFSNAFTAFIGIRSIQAIVGAADSFQLLRDRIGIFSKTTKEADETFRGIAERAILTRTSIESLATVYNRVIFATSKLGLSSEQTLDVVTALQNSYRVAGASMEEARASSIQLSQALGKGTLDGDELKTVLESNVVFSELLAKTLGVTTGQLKDLGSKGAIPASAVIRTLAENFGSLQERASKMGITIGQATTIAIDKFKIKLSDLARDMDVNGKLNTGIAFFLNNFELIFGVLVSIASTGVILKISSQLTTLFTSGTLLATAMAALPALIFALLSASIVFSDKIAKYLTEPLVKIRLKYLEFKAFLLEFFLGAQDYLVKIGVISNSFATSLTKGAASAYLKETNKEIKKTDLLLQGLAKAQEDLNKKPLKNPGSSLKDLKVKDINTVKEKVKKISDLQRELINLNKKFKDGSITFSEYEQSLSNFKLKDLNKSFQEGKIDVEQYFEALNKIPDALTRSEQAALGARTALQKYSEDATDLAKGINGAVTNILTGLEDALVSFVRKGKLSFADLTNAILDDIARIAIRASITGPLAGALGGLFSPGAPAAASGGGGSVVAPIANANGNAFSGGKILPFARGGVVSGPTLFPMKNGAGLMGEAGEEAIMPLTRRNGVLGVQGGGSNVVVNIVNNSGGQVETSETTGQNGERQLNILINDTVKNGIASGQFDKSFGESFGLSRRGR